MVVSSVIPTKHILSQNWQRGGDVKRKKARHSAHVSVWSVHKVIPAQLIGQ